LCTKIEANYKAGRTRDLLKTIEEVTGAFNPSQLGIKDISGNSLTDNEDVKRRWKEYTENLYRRGKTMTTKFTETEYVQESLVLESEVRAALHELADGKAPGKDDIPVDRCGWKQFVMNVAKDRKRPDGTR